MDHTKRVTWPLTSLRRFLTGLIQNCRRNIARISTQVFLLAYGMPNLPPILGFPFPESPVPRSPTLIFRSSYATGVRSDEDLLTDAAFFARTRPHLFLAMVRVHVLEHMIDSGMRYKLLGDDLANWEDYFDFRKADRTLEALQFDIERRKMLVEFRYRRRGR